MCSTNAILKMAAEKKQKEEERYKEHRRTRTGKIIVFKNRDKEGWYESWTQGRDWLNFPHPFRIIVAANPGSGKTNMIKNIIVHARPHFKRIFLCHYDLETKEYDDIDVVKLEMIPHAKSKAFKGSQKNLLIIDDYDFKSLSKEEMNQFRSLFKYASTHRGLSIIVATQDFFNLPPIIRRLSNVYFIWKGSADLDSLYQVGRRIGYTKDEFKELLDLCKDKFDNICIDFTVNTPASVRLNGYTLIKGSPDYLRERDIEAHKAIALQKKEQEKEEKGLRE